MHKVLFLSVTALIVMSGVCRGEEFSASVISIDLQKNQISLRISGLKQDQRFSFHKLVEVYRKGKEGELKLQKDGVRVLEKNDTISVRYIGGMGITRVVIEKSRRSK